MNVLILGSGGREHSLLWKCKQSRHLDNVYICPGNAGTNKHNVNIDLSDLNNVVAFCKQQEIDLVIIGSETYLACGIVDILSKQGIKAFGPTKFAAQLESSKGFTKDLCIKYGIPTADYNVFNNAESACLYLTNIDYPVVIKADGLAAGKGVIIAEDATVARIAIEEIFAGKFGDAGKKIVIEEYLSGTELSVFAICDGNNAKIIGTARDYKRVGEDNKGANTGGMGTYSAYNMLTDNDYQEITELFIDPVIKAMQDHDEPYTGVLFIGLMLTPTGKKLLEYNVRFGDPECQSIMALLENDILELMTGDIKDIDIKNKNKHAVTVVLASNGYPGKYQKNIEIDEALINKAENDIADLVVFHAGTGYLNDKLCAVGGRVLNLTASGDSPVEARYKAYKGLDIINWQNGFYRKDIAL